MKKDANSSISKHFRNTYTEQFFIDYFIFCYFYHVS